MSLALAEAAAPSASLDKGKRVVEVVSDDEKSAEGQVFKRQKTTHHAPQQVASTTSSSHGAESLREYPPSATSPLKRWIWRVGSKLSPQQLLHLPQNSPSPCRIR